MDEHDYEEHLKKEEILRQEKALNQDFINLTPTTVSVHVVPDIDAMTRDFESCGDLRILKEDSHVFIISGYSYHVPVEAPLKVIGWHTGDAIQTKHFRIPENPYIQRSYELFRKIEEKALIEPSKVFRIIVTDDVAAYLKSEYGKQGLKLRGNMHVYSYGSPSKLILDYQGRPKSSRALLQWWPPVLERSKNDRQHIK